ncbi:MAG TPA: hypothetical protein VG652_07880 [Gaiellaceae bacterium]|nr:hypothetical protein [Gaiellaceae bacterium]
MVDALTPGRLTTLLVVVFAIALAGGESPHASIRVTPGCNANATVSLNIAAAARTPSGSGSTVGTAEANQLAASLQAGGGNICSAAAGSAIHTQLAAIAALYATNRTAAHQQLVALIAEIKSGTIHAPLRRLSGARRATSICPSVQSQIHVSAASKTADDLAAEATAQKGGDTAGADAAAAAATSDFEQWATDSGASSVGDWIAIARGAQAIGDESFATSALDSARSAADAAVKKATPADPCKATAGELSCFIQANAIAQMLGGEGTPDLAKKLDCGELWSFTMVLSGQSTGGTFGTFTWKPGRFTVNTSTGTVTDASAGGPGWTGSSGGTYSCHGTGIPSESGSVAPFSFHYTLKGKATANVITISAPSSDFSMRNPFHGAICKGFGQLGVEVINAFVKAGIPIPFKVAAGQTKAVFSENEGGGTFRATIEKISDGH